MSRMLRSGSTGSSSNNNSATEAPNTASTARVAAPAGAGTSREPIVVMPGDVLLGRGKGAYEWAGNIEYQKVIASYLPYYITLTQNNDKILVTKEVVRKIRERGNRFLRGDSPNDVLYEVSDQEARIKVSQALRHQRRLLSEGHLKEATTSKKPKAAPSSSTKQPARPKKTKRPSRKQAPQPSVHDNGESRPVITRETERESVEAVFDIPAIALEEVHSDDISEFSLVDMEGDEGGGWT